MDRSKGNSGNALDWLENPVEIKRRLLERRQALSEIAESSAESRQPVELDQTRVGRLSRMDALQGQAMSLETERRRQNEINRIDMALARLVRDEYGECVSCGEEIAPKRLALDLAIATCIDCAAG